MKKYKVICVGDMGDAAMLEQELNNGWKIERADHKGNGMIVYILYKE